MAIKFKWPWLGIIIPSIIILVIGLGSHFFVLKNHVGPQEQIIFEIVHLILWLNYYLAITVPPGSPSSKFEPKNGEWRKWCKKCKLYKPERSHHCKTCNVCVLQMDHHCPWTNNCVGYCNYMHFIRFIIWILIGTTYVAIRLSERAISYYNQSSLPSYLIQKSELVAVIVLLPADLFVLLSVGILFVRCLINALYRGMTQIEVWEWERIENQINSGRIWPQIQRNYQLLHNEKLPNLVSWSGEPKEGDEPWSTFTIDDLIFPYNLGICGNFTAVTGSSNILSWIIPWVSPSSIQGETPTKSKEWIEEDQLHLPWPLDGGHQEPFEEPEMELESMSQPEAIKYLRRINDPRRNLKRNEWMNDLGETLDDFGVDLDAEDEENYQLIPKSN